MDDQLAAYRARKAKEREDNQSSLPSRAFTFASGVFRSRNKVPSSDISTTTSPTDNAHLKPSVPIAITSEGEILTEEKPWFTTQTILKIILWFSLWGVFVEIGFGAVYFVVSSLIIVYFNTRTGPKRDGKLSAYSVFNPKYERIDGTFTAEQFEKELRFGAGSVH